MIPRLRQQLNEQLMSDQLAVDLLSSYLRMDLSAQPWDPAAIARPGADRWPGHFAYSWLTPSAAASSRHASSGA